MPDPRSYVILDGRVREGGGSLESFRDLGRGEKIMEPGRKRGHQDVFSLISDRRSDDERERESESDEGREEKKEEM